jgi:7,8-didemethyl-8-hydroxy-5-deazariboflavin synthase CofH subunit
MPEASPNGNHEMALSELLATISPSIARTLEDALNGRDIAVDEAVALLEATGLELHAATMVADELRRQAVGDVVTYVVNRNVNFTNVCIKRCGFCAFSRDFRLEEGYFLPINEIIRRVKEAESLGATEVCIQAGLPPQMEGDLYIKLCEALKQEAPAIHIHGFSPEEVLYGSIRSRISIKEYLAALKDAGVGSLPGTSAEILDQELRDRISPGRIRVEQWIEVITTAHELGIPTTSTIMYGHVETSEHVARHLDLIRSIQKSTGGITEFVPLSFVHTEAPMFARNMIEGMRPGPTGLEILRMHVVARIMLNNWIPNLQVSWPKEGPRLAQMLLAAGVNDMGGTLINESISTAAGAQHGQLLKPREIRELIRGADRIPAERFTTYGIKRMFEDEDSVFDPLDQVDEDDIDRFGSYQKLIGMDSFRYEHPKYAARDA